MQDERTRRAKYLGFVAHEIKNPLSTALWSADLLKRLDSTDRGGPRAEKMVDASLRALRRMRRLVDDFFTIERLGHGLLEMRREPTLVKGVVDAAIALMPDRDRTQAGEWTVDVPTDLRADCDAELCKRALRALFEHVARAGEGPLTLVGSTVATATALWIGRRGPSNGPLTPPPPEEQPGGDPDGSVLGFLLARTVVAAHGGAIEEVDGGLTITLPLATG